MDKSVIRVKDAAKQLGCDKSSLLKSLKKAHYKIGKVYDDESGGQEVSVILKTDFENFKILRGAVQW